MADCIFAMTSNWNSKQPAEVPESISDSKNPEFNLDGKNLTSLPDDLCAKFSHLTLLSANNNFLETIPSYIDQLSKLTELHLKENSLSFLPGNIVKLRSLQKLHITGNLIRELPENIHMLENLSELFADDNEIEALPLSFGNCNNLSILNLSSNVIRCLPDTFGNMKKLKELDLSHNCLTSLPCSFQDFPSLETINLTNNRIKVLPDKFSSVKKLRKLFMNENLLEAIPAWFSDLENCTELFLTDNKLQGSVFPKDFGSNCDNLEQIVLSGNDISLLPDNIGRLKNLTLLNLGRSFDEPNHKNYLSNGIKLWNLPKSICDLKNLSKLVLDGNNIEMLPTSFGFLFNLVYLDLSHNMLKCLPLSFGQLHHLQVCLLGVNKLTFLPNSFGSLAALGELKLNDNLLEHLPKSFENLTTLTLLDLYGNNLKEIPQSLSFLRCLKFLDLRENDFEMTIGDVDFTQGSEGQKYLQMKNGQENEILCKAIASASKWKRSRQYSLRDNSSSIQSPIPNGINSDSGDNLDGFSMNGNFEEESMSEDKYWDDDLQSDTLCSKWNYVNLDRMGDFADDFSDWEEDSDSYFPDNFSKVYRHPTSDEPSHLNMNFIPSDLHMKPFQVQEVWCPFEEGQFDDAES